MTTNTKTCGSCQFFTRKDWRFGVGTCSCLWTNNGEFMGTVESNRACDDYRVRGDNPMKDRE